MVNASEAQLTILNGFCDLLGFYELATDSETVRDLKSMIHQILEDSCVWVSIIISINLVLFKML